MSAGAAAETLSQNVTDARQEAQIWMTYALNAHLLANDLMVSVQNGKATKGMATTVRPKAGKVTLSGTARSAEAKNLAGRLAMNSRGVEAVDNQLMAGAAKPTLTDSGKASASDAERDISDSWITTKVKSTLLYSSNVAGSGITVDTKNGVVTLSDKVNSDAERASAVELAQNVCGVKRVPSKDLKI